MHDLLRHSDVLSLWQMLRKEMSQNNEKMSDAEIDQAIRDAEQYAAEDTVRRDALTVCSEAQRLLSQVDRALGVAGKQLNKEEKTCVKEDYSSLRKLVNRAKPDKMTDRKSVV